MCAGGQCVDEDVKIVYLGFHRASTGLSRLWLDEAVVGHRSGDDGLLHLDLLVVKGLSFPLW